MKILDRRELPTREGEQPCEIILVKREHAFHPFVTWQRNIPEKGGDGGKYWGHYFKADEEAKARKDFAERGH